ncbi:MAG: UDP-2,3-diacetamido-2,3-dideoxy-D-glucuronate 2-epimerase [Chloroflexi bacterium ADurb.Bin325]|nr:MAG: UDP-2,3-diacetamido-2,3-dideoxy-D-glucuronate 2-epimerase [Chloroflexi bacterium ADurb.Bin325]
MKIVTIVGARPQFIKAAPVSRVLRRQHREVLVHTGQHYDRAMSDVFFAELAIPRPDYELGIGSGSHGQQTGQMLMRIEEVLQAEQPDWALVYGDTNSTLAGALAAAKLGIRVAHVEAGLRSFNRSMPEEHNRVLTDHCADLLLCPTQTAVDLLAAEGVTRGVHLVGDVMYDAARQFAEVAAARSTILADLGLSSGGYALATLHRPYNTDDPARLRVVLAALNRLGLPVIFPVHPRTRARLAELGGADCAAAADGAAAGLRCVDPVGYMDMLALEQNARLILTDSGGVQKEAYFFAVPCVTLRPETEWVETVQAGWNRLAWGDAELVLAAARGPWPDGAPPPVFGDGYAAERIAALLHTQGG